MKARLTVLSILVVSTLFSVVSCARKADNPAAPNASTPTAVTTPDTEGVGAASHTRVQNWRIRDQCSDGKGITARLWEARNRKLTGRFTRIFKTRSGGTISFRLLCLTGTSGCVGATTNPPGGGSWGVGLDAERPKFNLSYCKACSSNTATVTLICGRAATGEGLVLDGAFDDALVGVEDEGLVTFEE